MVEKLILKKDKRMKKRKKSANWYVAATHYLTAGFVVPFFVFLVSSLALIPLVASLDLLILEIATLVGMIFLSIWLGVMYSARYLRKAYIIDEEAKRKVVKLSTIYFAVLNGGPLATLAFLLGQPAALIVVAIMAFMFYSMSQRYISLSIEEDVVEKTEEE